MHIDTFLLTAGVAFAAGLLALLTLLAALWRAPWAALRVAPVRQHLWFLVVLSLVVLWLMSFRLTDGVTLHLLGMTVATALLGVALSVLAGLAALLVLVAAERLALPALPMAWLLGVVVPALATGALLTLLARSRLRNLFVFLLGIGFVGGMVSVLATLLATALVLVLSGQGELLAVALPQVALLPLLLFPEGFINGAALSTLTVYFPHLVRGFDEERFLAPPDEPPR